jgi:hypothetical protein
MNKIKRANRRRTFPRHSTIAHDPWLVLNLERFNLAGRWNQLRAREQTEQFGK